MPDHLTIEPGIRERSPGRYELRAYNKGTGRQVTRTYVAPRAERGAGIREARRALAKLRTEIADGALGGSNSTLAYVLDDWLKAAVSLERSPNTLYGYRVKLRRIKAHPIAAKRVAKLTTRDVDLFYRDLRAEGMSPATLLAHHRVLRAALNHAVKQDWVPANVARLATTASAEKPEMVVPTTEQANALLARAARTHSPQLAAVLLFAILSGARRGEVCGLQWADVDFTASRVTFRRSVWQIEGEMGTKSTKTRRVRTIALDDLAMTLLRARLSEAMDDAAQAGVPWSNEAFVWSTQADGRSPRPPNTLTQAFDRLCETMEREAAAAGRTERWPFRLHDLRHLSATQMVSSGMDIATVAARLGHATPSVTLNVYSHALAERDREAAQGLGAAFGQALALPAGD